MTFRRFCPRGGPLVAARCACVAAAFVGTASAETEAHRGALPITATLGYENVTVAPGERMGLVGASLLFGLGDWRLGPAMYGAARGERGGLFVGGLEVQRRWTLGTSELSVGLFAGGGGGAGAPVGDGLMLRPALTLWHPLGPWRAGLSWSEVRFPSGSISSQQWGLLLAWEGQFRHADVSESGLRGTSTWRSGLQADHIAATATRYSLAGAAARTIGLTGARIERREVASGGQRWTVGLDLAGAASGDAAGYMEILAAAQVDTPLDDAGRLRVGVRGALGLGGGGGVPTGGGGLARVTAGLSWRLSSELETGIEFGRLLAGSTALRANVAQWWIGVALEPEPGADGSRSGQLRRTEWALVLQRYARAPRRAGPDAPLDTVGLRLVRHLDDALYLTGQGHTAFGGGAGAYSIGLVGAGFARELASPGGRIGAEVLVGAAGGGGVASGGGGIVQALAWTAWRPSPRTPEWRLGVGAMRSGGGGRSSPVIELSLAWPFAQLSAR